jgi:hypothetical protein
VLVQEASRGGLVKCPECETLNGKSSAKCKSCGHDLKQVAAKAKSDGRSHVSEAVQEGLRGLIGRQRRNRRGEFVDVPGVGDDAPKKPLPTAREMGWIARGTERNYGSVNVRRMDHGGWVLKSRAVTGSSADTAEEAAEGVRTLTLRDERLGAEPPMERALAIAAQIDAELARNKREGYEFDLPGAPGVWSKKRGVAEAVSEVLEAGDEKAKAKGGRKAGRSRKGKFADLPTLATGKRAPKEGDAATAGSADGKGPTSVAEAVSATLEADAWGGKPGTNWKQVSPSAKGKLKGILNHYKGMAHPFTSCVKDNTKRFGPEGAKKVCAVVKDLNEKSTGWRKGGKTQEAAAELDVFVDRLLEAAAGEDGTVDVELVCEAVMDQLPPLVRAILESVIATGEVLEAQGLRGRQRKDRIGRFADVPGVGDDAPLQRRNRTGGTSSGGGGKPVKSLAKPNKKPYTGGSHVVLQNIGGGQWTAVDGANTPEAAKKKASKYPGETKVFVNDKGAEPHPGTYTAWGVKVPADYKPPGGGSGSASTPGGAEQAEVTAAVQAVLPGANVRKTKNGYAVGGFSKPPAVAQKMLRDAGLDASDDFGQTVVKPKRKSVKEAVAEALA